MIAVLAVDLVQSGGLPTDPPPLGRALEQLTFYMFLVVMLVVPLLLSRGLRDSGAPSAGPSDAVSSRLFTSRKERHLWMWTAAVVAAIYATLGPAADVAAFLRARGLLTTFSSVVILAVAAALVIPWARTRPGLREVGVALGVTAVYVTTLIRMPVPEARSHLFEYGLVAMLVYHALMERRENGRAIPVPSVWAVLITATVGWVDEGIQAFLPNRVYDLVDVGFNALAALMAVVATVLMGWARRLDILGRLRGEHKRGEGP